MGHKFYLKDDLFYYFDRTERISEVLVDQMWVIECNFLKCKGSDIMVDDTAGDVYGRKKRTKGEFVTGAEVVGGVRPSGDSGLAGPDEGMSKGTGTGRRRSPNVGNH